MLLVRLLCSYTNQQSDVSKRKNTHARLTAGSKTIYLCWGLRWGLLWGMIAGSGKVVSGAPPAVAVGSSSMTITGALALFAALWARVLKRNEFRVKQIRYKTETARIEELQVQQGILLFLFLVGAERGEVEVRPTFGATRRRSRFP